MNSPNLETVPVALGDRSYEIHIGAGLLPRLGRHVAEDLGAKRAVLISDDVVAPHYDDVCLGALAAAGVAADRLIIPAGEAAKSWQVLGGLLDRLLALKPDRGTVLIALGGGVIGDLAGFAAAILLRGVRLVQVPTTLLAQVDSAVGGKTGINARQGKNLIGAFLQPTLVLSDIDVLASLPARQLRSGYAEIVKYGVIDRPDFFAWLEAGGGAALLAGDTGARVRAIAESCRAKAAVVAADEREGGGRALLNLGHTFGHALEADLAYDGRLTHGEGVAIGMCLALALSADLGLCAAAEGARLAAHLQAVGLPTQLADIRGVVWDLDRLAGHMQHDKKTVDGRLTFILASGIGRSHIARQVPADRVRRVLAESACPAER